MFRHQQAPFQMSLVRLNLIATSSGNQSVLEWSKLGLEEGVSDQRFMRFMNPVFKYDFKVGNYLPDDAKKLNPHLFMTIKDITTGIRKSS